MNSMLPLVTQTQPATGQSKNPLAGLMQPTTSFESALNALNMGNQRAQSKPLEEIMATAELPAPVVEDATHSVTDLSDQLQNEELGRTAGIAPAIAAKDQKPVVQSGLPVATNPEESLLNKDSALPADSIPGEPFAYSPAVILADSKSIFSPRGYSAEKQSISPKAQSVLASISMGLRMQEASTSATAETVKSAVPPTQMLNRIEPATLNKPTGAQEAPALTANSDPNTAAPLDVRRPVIQSSTDLPGSALNASAPLNAQSIIPQAAPTPTTSAQLISVPVDQSAWGKALGQQLIGLHMRGEQEAELQLNPAELGPLSVKLKLSDQSANLQFMTSHVSVRAAIEQAIPQLKEALSEQGIKLSDTSVGEHRQHNHKDQPQQNRTVFVDNTVEENLPAVIAHRTTDNSQINIYA